MSCMTILGLDPRKRPQACWDGVDPHIRSKDFPIHVNERNKRSRGIGAISKK